MRRPNEQGSSADDDRAARRLSEFENLRGREVPETVSGEDEPDDAGADELDDEVREEGSGADPPDAGESAAPED